MLFCREPGCLGWSLSPSDQFCAWCGERLVEVTISFESKLGEDWVPLTPPVLNRERPPALRLRISHEGEAGSFPLQPEQLQCSVPWLGFDTSKITDVRLQPGETVHLLVNRLKVPGKEETYQEAKIALAAGASGEASHNQVGSLTLSFVPPPRFLMDLETQEVLLSAEGAPTLEGSLVLERGRVWLEAAPRLVGDWATLELLDEDPTRPLKFPLELDGREQPRLNFKLHFGADQVNDIRATGSENPTALRRNNKLVLTCRDRGMRMAGLTQESLKVELPLQLNFILAPEIVLEPFTAGSRADWSVVLGGNDHEPFKVQLFNGPPGSGGRQALQVRQLSLRSRQSELDKCFTLELPRPTPWTLEAGESLEFALRFHASKLSWMDGDSLASAVELVLVSNDPIGRAFYLDFRLNRPKPFPGYLAIDLGTSNTCAALVDENRLVTLVPLDRVATEDPRQLASAVCYLKLRRERELEWGERAVQRSREPSATRAVVIGAKRRIGNPDWPFPVTPLDEPAETLQRSAEEVLQDIYQHVIERASSYLLEQLRRPEMVITRLAITHPSRFSVTQVGHLKNSASGALGHHVRGYFPERGEPLPEPVTMHEPIGAALHFLNDWRQQAELYEQLRPQGDSLLYHLFVYDFGGGTLDITLVKVQCQRQPLRNPTQAEHGYSYTVAPLVLGAMGERWFGGQDVTRALVGLLRMGLEKQASGAQLLWPESDAAPSDGPQLQQAARRNESLLTAWAEQLKIALVDQRDLEDLLLSFPSLHFWEGGKERLQPASQLRRGLVLPTLEQLQDEIRPRLRESLRRAELLISRHQLESPDLVLQVGQSCRLPAVEEALRERFPQAVHVRSKAPKSCVVEGAGATIVPGVSGGVQLSRGVDRPGVRLKLAREQTLSATTSRIGIKVLDGGKSWFQEILGEGIPIPPEGLQQELDGLVLEAGSNSLTLLENCGNQDEVVVGKQTNPEIQVVRECHFDLPGTPGTYYEDCVIRLVMAQDLSLKMLIKTHEEWQEVAHIHPETFGRMY